MNRQGAPETRIAFLSRAQSYPEPTANVASIETHMSWVFLTDHYAYKLKKPVRTADVDLRDLAARFHNCLEEVRLNRRLTSGVYLETVPLSQDAAGRLTLTGDGDAVDWLVKMRRLPGERMLDRLIAERSVQRADVEAIVDKLYAFYRLSSPVDISALDYRREFAAAIEAHARELEDPEYSLPAALIERASAPQLALLKQAAMFDARVHERRIIEGHGDLRPEHICLQGETQIIDCLEFSFRLRTLDPVDELGFLALECERLGAPYIGREILDLYRRRSGDAAPDSLAAFYQGHRALVRATLAARHLREPFADSVKWTARARHYLELACAHVERSAG